MDNLFFGDVCRMKWLENFNPKFQDQMIATLKTNMEPEITQMPSRRKIIFQISIFRFQPLIFQGVFLKSWPLDLESAPLDIFLDLPRDKLDLPTSAILIGEGLELAMKFFSNPETEIIHHVWRCTFPIEEWWIFQL